MGIFDLLFWGAADAWSGAEVSAICWYWTCRYLVGVGSICNLLDLDLQMPGRGWKHLQFAGIGFVDAWSESEVSAICWYWICRCLVGVGSICNLLVLDLQMPGRGWKHLQLAGIRVVDAWSGLEASAICWNWICRCLSWGWKHLQFAGIGFVDAWSGSEASAIC